MVILEAWEIMTAYFFFPALSLSLSAQTWCKVNEIPLEQKLSHYCFLDFYGCISVLCSWTFFLVLGEIKNELTETFEFS